MKDEKVTNSAKDSLLEALDDNSMGAPDTPTLPLVGSENVPVTPEEERDYE